MSVIETLAGADTAGYLRAIEPRPFDFPSDHGPHERFRTEWWYVTGNLRSLDGRDFGFQLTIFRSALSPRMPSAESGWATRQAYMGHFAITDVASRTFHAHERFARGALGLAGAVADPLRVWVEDWSLEGSPTATFPLLLRAAEGVVDLRLELERGKPVVLHGIDGLSAKGPRPGDASYYYAYTRMPAEGVLVVDGESIPVRGDAWLDREWSTSALAEGQVGWDWFALQLDDGWELTLFRIRRGDGTTDPVSAGALIDPAGARLPLTWGRDVTVESTATWASPLDGAEYPAEWRVSVTGRGWELSVAPLLAGQELDLAFRYWEGAVRIDGVGEGGRAVAGKGYVELTGYAGEAPGR